MPTRWSWRGWKRASWSAGSSLADAPIVAVSAKTGDGLDALRARAGGGRRGGAACARPTVRRGCRSIASSRCAASARS